MSRPHCPNASRCRCLDWLETAAAVRALADAVKKAAGVGGTKRQKHTR